MLVEFPTELVFEYWLNDPNEEWLNGTKSACKLWGWSNIDGWFWFNQFATVACGLLIVGLTIFWSMLESKVSVFSSWKDSEMEVVSISSSESLSSLSLVWILSPSGVDPRSCELNLHEKSYLIDCHFFTLLHKFQVTFLVEQDTHWRKKNCILPLYVHTGDFIFLSTAAYFYVRYVYKWDLNL